MKTYKEKIETVGNLAVLGTGFSIPLSTSLVTLFSSLAVLVWLFSGRFLETPRIILQNPVVRAALLLFLLLFIGVSYSSGDLSEAFDYLKKYRELLLILVFVSLLRGSQMAKWGMHAFLIGSCILLLLSYFSEITGIHLSRFGSTPISTITHNLFMAYVAFWAAHEFLSGGKYRWAWGALVVLATLNIFTMIIGRTGQVIFIALFFLFMLQRLDLKTQVTGLVSLIVLLGVFFQFSETFSARVAQVGTDIQNYEGGNAGLNNSVGLRLEWLENSLELIGRNPVFGYGTGSFPEVYGKLADKKGLIRTDNPHNEYLMITVQVGLLGVMLFLYLFYRMWVEAGTLEAEKMWLARGLILSMAVGCLANSFLLDSREGHFFAYFTALFFKDLPPIRGSQAVASAETQGSSEMKASEMPII